jgi:hypothetical protein
MKSAAAAWFGKGPKDNPTAIAKTAITSVNFFMVRSPFLKYS